MEDCAVSINNLRDYKCRSIGYVDEGCSLYEALNRPETTVEDVMRWHWQISEYAVFIREYYALYPIDVNIVHVDSRGNIVTSSIIRPTKCLQLDSELLIADSIIKCHSIMIENMNIKCKSLKLKKEIKIFNILAECLLLHSEFNTSTDLVADAYILVDRFCAIIESGTVSKLAKVCFN